MREKTKKIFIGLVLSGIFLAFLVKAECPSQTTVSGTEVTFVGELTDMGGDAVTYCWFEYGIISNLGSKTSEIPLHNTGLYCTTVSGLSPCTTYYYRAVARNSAGTAYGEIKTFTTSCTTETKEFSIKKRMRNLSDGTGWGKTVYADPGEVIEVKIEVRAGQERVTNVKVKDSIPQKTKIISGSLKLEGQKISGDITSGINIGEIKANEKKKITFKLQIEGSDVFGYGETRLVNEARATVGEETTSDTATIVVKKTGVLAASTGIETKTFFQFLALPLISAILAILVLKPYLIEFDDWLKVKSRDWREVIAKKLLQMKIAKIKKKKI